MTDYSFILRKMSADGQGYFSEEDRLRLLNAADRIAELEAALEPIIPDTSLDEEEYSMVWNYHLVKARAAYLGDKE